MPEKLGHHETSCSRFSRPMFAILTAMLIMSSASITHGQGNLTPLALNTRPPSDEAVRTFVGESETALEQLNGMLNDASWMASVEISAENSRRAAEADATLNTEWVRRATTARGFSSSDPIIQRRLVLLRLAADGLNNDPAAGQRSAELRQQMEAFYEQACPEVDAGQPCLQHDAFERLVRTTRDPARLRLLWETWYNTAAQQAPAYREYTNLLNQGARDSGRTDAAEVSLAAYEVDPTSFERELDALWTEVQPLYRVLHAYARARLAQRYPNDVDPRGPIPIHLLGNLWGQEWEGIADILLAGGGSSDSSDRAFAAAGLNSRGMVEVSARFFESLGFPALPATFWERSYFQRPLGPEGRPRPNFACHATAWMLRQGDWRLRVCFEPNWPDFLTAHHETGHIFYNQSMDPQPFLFRQAPNQGINEAIGDAVMLSVTPAYLERIGLGSLAPRDNEVDALLRVALRKVARIPFGLALVRWRWGVQSGRIPPNRWNAAWWEMVREYQGLAPPGPRPADAFDPAAKRHIATGDDYTRYFLADVLTFQIHEALVRAAGCTEPVHRCSAYGSREAGTRLREAMAMGASRPWQEVLETMTGSRAIRGEPLRRYLAPLEDWLIEQTRDVPTGW